MKKVGCSSGTAEDFGLNFQMLINFCKKPNPILQSMAICNKACKVMVVGEGSMTCGDNESRPLPTKLTRADPLPKKDSRSYTTLLVSVVGEVRFNFTTTLNHRW